MHHVCVHAAEWLKVIVTVMFLLLQVAVGVNVIIILVTKVSVIVQAIKLFIIAGRTQRLILHMYKQGRNTSHAKSNTLHFPCICRHTHTHLHVPHVLYTWQYTHAQCTYLTVGTSRHAAKHCSTCTTNTQSSTVHTPFSDTIHAQQGISH